MDHLKKLITFLFLLHSTVIASESIDSIYLDRVHRNISDFSSLNTFYRNLLQDIRHHRPIDTVISPINVTRIRLNGYDKSYRNSVSSMIFFCFNQNSISSISVTKVCRIFSTLTVSIEAKFNYRKKIYNRYFQLFYLLSIILAVNVNLHQQKFIQ